MRALVIGGAGFVGLNIAHHLAELGHDVMVLDRQQPPAAVCAALGDIKRQISFISGTVTEPETYKPLIRQGADWMIYGAAITSDAHRDAAEPETVLAVNLSGFVSALRAARSAGVRRVINLSSVGALGQAAGGPGVLDETRPADPVSLYSVTKFASERVADRLASLWEMEIVNVRLSSVFGPFERATGVRDTLSPLGQIMMAAVRGEPALLERQGLRDWIYAPDAANAIARIVAAPKLAHRLYNVTSAQTWPALQWGEKLARLRAGFVCRLTRPGELATINLHAAADRAPLSPGRLHDELAWTAKHGLDASLESFEAWARRWGHQFWGAA